MADTRIVPPRDVSTPTQNASLGHTGTAAGSPATPAVPTTSGTPSAAAAAAQPPASSANEGSYAALAQRVTITEQTLAALQAQVAQLAAAVKNVLPGSILSPASQQQQQQSGPPAMGGGRLFSPFDSPVSTPTAQQSRQAGGDGSQNQISQLTQQISALSTSVAQLQRLQTHNIGAPPLSIVPPSPASMQSKSNGHSQHGGINNQPRHMTPVHEQFGGPLSPAGAMLSPAGGMLSPGRDSYSGGQRAPNRTFQSSLLGDGIDSMWGAPSSAKFSGSSALSGGAPGGNARDNCQVRDPVRVLVRREGSTNSQESVSSITPGINVKHTYVYLTITGSARSEDQSAEGPGTIGSGRANSGTMSEEAARAKEYKLDTLIKMLDDYPLWQAVIHRQMETLYLVPDATPSQKKAILQQWRMSVAGQGPRFLVCFDVTPKPPDIPWSPLVINFDLPRSVEGYALRAAAAVPPPQRQPNAPHYNGVIVSFVQAAGGDVEMLRSTECAYRFKSAEIPTVFHDLFQH